MRDGVVDCEVVFDLACLLTGWGQPDPVVEELAALAAGFSPDGVSATPKVKVSTIRRTGRRVCVGGSPADSVPMSFGPGSCLISESQPQSRTFDAMHTTGGDA